MAVKIIRKTEKLPPAKAAIMSSMLETSAAKLEVHVECGEVVFVRSKNGESKAVRVSDDDAEEFANAVLEIVKNKKEGLI